MAPSRSDGHPIRFLFVREKPLPRFSGIRRTRRFRYGSSCRLAAGSFGKRRPHPPFAGGRRQATARARRDSLTGRSSRDRCRALDHDGGTRPAGAAGAFRQGLRDGRLGIPDLDRPSTITPTLEHLQAQCQVALDVLGAAFIAAKATLEADRARAGMSIQKARAHGDAAASTTDATAAWVAETVRCQVAAAEEDLRRAEVELETLAAVFHQRAEAVRHTTLAVATVYKDGLVQARPGLAEDFPLPDPPRPQGWCPICAEAEESVR